MYSLALESLNWSHLLVCIHWTLTKHDGNNGLFVGVPSLFPKHSRQESLLKPPHRI